MRRQSQAEKMLRDKGWELARNKRHQIWRCPCGDHTITVASSIGKGRALRNLQADIRRSGCG